MLNPRRFRDAQARTLGLGARARIAWAKERRIVQAVRLAASTGRTYLVANMHCTSYATDERLADAELRRAAWFAVSEAQPEDIVVLAGDFNLQVAQSPTLGPLSANCTYEKSWRPSTLIRATSVLGSVPTTLAV